MNKIENAEIFRTGVWKGKLFTEADLDEMVRNYHQFKDGWFRPAVKGGHDSTPGLPALGYVSNLRRIGSKLMADLVDLPHTLYEAIKGKRYDRVSAEIIPNLEKNGRTYGKVLSALAILGHELPEVTGLRPLRECFSNEYGYVCELYETPLTIEGVRTMSEIGDEVDRKVKEFMFTHNEGDYGKALDMVLGADPILKNQYAMTVNTYNEYPAGKFSQKEISEEVDRRVKTLLKENRALSYAEAMIAVLQADEGLKKAYHGSYHEQVK